MLEFLYLRKRWFSYGKLMKNYPSNSYYLLKCGIRNVKTQDIIGLSLWPPEKLAKDKKSVILRTSVKKHGWKDPFPNTIDLYMLPNGKYTVCEGGNHRPIIADELKIPKIKADVQLIVLKSIMDKEAIQKIELLKKQIELNYIEIEKIVKFLNSKGVGRIKYVSEENKLSTLSSYELSIYSNINDILKKEAINKGLVSASYFQ